MLSKYQQGWAEIHQKQLAFVKESVREAVSKGKFIERAEDDAVDLAIDDWKLNK